MTKEKQLSAVAQVAKRLSISEPELTDVVKKTIFPSGKQVTNEQFVSFMAVANEYNLNPLTKQIYAFPSRGGGIQPIVSVDGWLAIINSHPDFDGMTFDDIRDGGNLVAITCSIHRKGIEKPIQVTEYMNECRQSTDVWKKYPSRMLRHKAAIQAGRYAFGLSGIIEPDEAERFADAGVIDVDGEVIDAEPVVTFYENERFQKHFAGFEKAIKSGKQTAESIIAMIEKESPLTEVQKQKLNDVVCDPGKQSE
jgi:phage recombination protein Bet